ncbi:protocatechuate 3,4-dioxygenase [Paraburkholderia domus]|uniref:DODA-type extradiol aromatic ring-opening family dioxygenase n=1 Tax=Paraburkholderia domus TaxID=2793075 RepID=UPI0019126DBF|nr:protocatechuate 3,4-dioxygenase [Paraburkholderia domus]MBK5065913.1 protocatechuate 3,4-dioxygenase [Burkholderia sp. R-70199]CAE6959394.1 Protocatechuate 4,5-dioxygenase beta chain [Paraburkholderia domus]
MATVIAGIGISHTPSMGVEYDRGIARGFDLAWKIWYDGTRRVQALLDALKPDHAIVVYNDHLNYFDLDTYPTLAIGIGDTFRQADEGWGRRPVPDLRGDLGWGMHLADSLVHDEFDLTICQELQVDHGIFSWLPYVMEAPWPVPVTPIAVNMIRHPLPTNERLRKLGCALRRAVERFPREDRVVVIATGGMSHQISGARFGIANETFDRYFLRALPSRMTELVSLLQSDFMRFGGTEAAELAMWFSMRAALSDEAVSIYDFYTFPQITGCGALVMAEPCAINNDVRETL